MASPLATTGLHRRVIGTWHTGVGAGVAGVIPMILFNHVWLGNELFLQFGLIPFAVLWGVIYSGIAAIDRIGRFASNPRTAAISGIVYGFLVWMGPQIGEPIGQGTLTVNGVIQSVMFGGVRGLVYAYSPDAARE